MTFGEQLILGNLISSLYKAFDFLAVAYSLIYLNKG